MLNTVKFCKDLFARICTFKVKAPMDIFDNAYLNAEIYR